MTAKARMLQKHSFLHLSLLPLLLRSSNQLFCDCSGHMRSMLGCTIGCQPVVVCVNKFPNDPRPQHNNVPKIFKLFIPSPGIRAPIPWIFLPWHWSSGLCSARLLKRACRYTVKGIVLERGVSLVMKVVLWFVNAEQLFERPQESARRDCKHEGNTLHQL